MGTCLLSIPRYLFAFILLVGAFFACLLLSSSPVKAATGINQQLNFQGRLLNNQGATVPDGYYNIQFKIYQDGDGQSVGNTTGSPAGSLKWTESHLNANTQGVTVKNGFLSVQLGSITAFGASVDWNQDTLWLSMNIASTNPSCTPFTSCSPDGEMTPMKRLSSTPYAFNAGRIGGLTSAQFLQLAQGVQADSSAVSSIFVNKTGTGNVLQLQAAGVDALVVEDSGQVAIGQSTAAYALDVNGSIRAITSLLAPDLDTVTAVTLTIGDTTASDITIGRTGITTTVPGALTVTQATNLNGGLTTSNAGNVAFQRGTDYSTTGSQNNVNFGTGALIRLTGASAQTITGITGGIDGRILTLVNAAAQDATIANNSGSSTAANRITTGTGADMTLAAGGSIQLVYDSGASLWRISSGAASDPNDFIQNQNAGQQATSNFWISGTGRADTSFTAPLVDALSGGTLNVGTTNATGVAIGSTANTTSVAIQGAAAATYTIGNTNTTGTITIGQTTTGTTAAVNILSANGTASTQTISIGDGTSTTSGGKVVNIANGVPGASTTNTVAIGTGGSATGTVGITLGSATAAAHTTLVQGGNGNGAGTEAIRLQTSAAGGIAIGTAAQTGTLTLGQATTAATQTVNIQSADGTSSTQTINIGGGTSTMAGGKVVNIANGIPGASTTNTVAIGSAGTTTGTVGVTIGSIGAAAHTTSIRGGNGAGAISIQAATSGTIAIGTTAANTINIATGAFATNVNVGNTTGGTITIGAASGSDLVLQDAQWGVTGAGVATFADVVCNSASCVSTGEITTDTIDWTDISDAMTLDDATSIAFTAAVNGIGLDLNVTNAAAQTAVTGFEVTPTFTLDAADITLIGVNVNPNTNSNADAGDILDAVRISGVTSTAATEVALRIGNGYDQDILFATDATHILKVQDQDSVGGTGSRLEITGAAGNAAGTGGTVQLSGGAGGASGTGGALTLLSGNAAGGTAGNINIDVGTSTSGNGSILIGTAARAQTVTIGNTSGGTITVGAASGSDLALQDAHWSVTGAGAATFANITNGATAGSGTLTNNGSTVNTTLAVANDSDGGALGGTPGSPLTAAQSVDIYTSFSINQTTASQTITLPTPTANTTYGRVIYISNIGSTGFTVLGSSVLPGTTAALVWSNTNGGASWQYSGDGGGSGNYVQNQNAAQQASSNFWISGTGRADTSLLSPLVDALSGGTLSVGTTNATSVTIGSTTNTTAVTLQGAVAATYDIGTATGTGTITIGKATTAATQTVNIESANGTASTQTINIGGGTSTTSGGKVVNIATGVPGASTTNTVAIGNGGTTTGTVGITIGSNGAANHTTLIQGGNVATAGSEAIRLQVSNAGGIAIGTATQTGTITLGNATTAATQTVNIESANGTSSTQTVNIGAGTSTTAGGKVVNIATGTPGASTTNTVAIGNGGTTTGTVGITIGSNGAANHTTLIQGGNVATAGSEAIRIQTADAGGIAIGSATQTGTITLGKSTANNTINIGAVAGASGTQAINIGNSATASSITNVSIGSTIGTSTTTVSAGSGSIFFNSTLAQFTEITGTRTLGVQARTTNVAGTNLNISAGNAGSGGSAFAGGLLTLQGGNAAGTGNANGGGINISGGTGTGTGVLGLIGLSSTVFNTAPVQTFSSPGVTATTAGYVDTYSTLPITASVTGAIDTLTDPTITTIGRIIYVAARSGSSDVTLRLNAARTPIDITLKANSTATLIWNGTDWTAAGASSSTDLQAAYNNTATTAGAAELVLNPSGGAADGLTVRNNATTPIVGSLLEVQTSIGSNLFSVNNNATEYATNGGAETAGASGSTFPATTWDTTTGGTVDRYTTAGDNIATGQASVRVQTTTTNHGARNRISATLTSGLTYTVSFAVRGATNFSSLQVLYSPDGTTSGTTQCATAQTVTQGIWTRITCSFIAAGTITSSNSILIRQTDATARTFYLENLSINVNASATFAIDGSVDAALGTNWTNFGTLDSLTLETTIIYDTSGSVNVNTPNAVDRGVRNNMAINPAINTQYLVTFYARSSNTFNDIRVRYSRDGGTNFVSCVDYNTQVVSTTSFVEITCLFTTDGTTATNPDLIIDQPTGSDRNFYIDALSITLNTNNSNNVQVGGANKGGPVTLFTLDRSNGAPIAANNEAYLGSMYYDTSTGRIQCYEADGWGACGAPPDNIVNLNPEYPGAVLNGGGIGTMTADFCSNDTALSVNTTLCSTGEAKNYYRWTSPQATQQTYSIIVSYQLPATFKSFSSDDTVQLVARTDSTSNAALTYEMFKSDGSAVTKCGSGETTVVTTANTWQSVGINGNEATGCTFSSSSAGNFIIFKINLKANSNANAYVSTLSFTTTGR